MTGNEAARPGDTNSEWRARHAHAQLPTKAASERPGYMQEKFWTAEDIARLHGQQVQSRIVPVRFVVLALLVKVPRLMTALSDSAADTPERVEAVLKRNPRLCTKREHENVSRGPTARVATFSRFNSSIGLSCFALAISQ